MSAKAGIAVSALLAMIAAQAGGAYAQGGVPNARGTSKPGSYAGHAAALGRPGDASHVTRTVAVTMDDSMRFTPESIRVAKGETIRFEVRNAGRLRHEMVLGSLKELRAHAALMRKFPTMEHADPNQALVEPGSTGELIWQFTRAGTFDFACLQAGHFDAGMKGRIVVSAKPAPQVDGEVRNVDKAAGRITLKHGEIRNLEMPGMTMVFQVRDPALLDRVQAGDKVRFTAEKAGSAIVVTDIQAAK